MQHRELPEGWDRDIPVFPQDAKGEAERNASANVLNAIAKNVPWLIGGSADLAPSTKTRLTFDEAIRTLATEDLSAETVYETLADVDRSILEDHANGLVRVHVRNRKPIGSG